ncbi:hypothetical protein [Bradyrhizobium japonicum]|uniref:hypothetical protein n=1 Tax=Bradyrhizobium japonicum TaxID=375 RepID=UPI0020A2236B|nr:hypothetical protein [Bradyrhizobium japonicum]MCP1783881.1 hypothetical protein [Bradyrhizobium japonicum]MCP1963831.1 hypothetical protein [Bradyrhizobium japonicum]
MAIAATNKLSLLPFPQRWDPGASTIELRVLALPRGNPIEPLITGIPGVADGPAFADADLKIKALLLPGLGALPLPASVTAEVDLGTTPLAGLRALYEEVAAQFDIDPTLEAGFREPRRAGRQILKYLSGSYRSAFPFAGPRTPFAVTDDRYFCVLRDGCRLRKDPGPPPSTKTVWGRIIAQAVRQPLLAEKMGLLYRATFKLPDSGDLYRAGGWLYLGLTSDSAYADAIAARPDLLSSYAARIPPLGADDGRILFTPVLFPVASAPPPGDYDEVQAEAAEYDDGFARIVHCAQHVTSDTTGLAAPGATPPITDSGFQLGWDDEQIIIWQNRQISDPASDPRNAPMGVRGYRIDVREEGSSAPWTSLMRAEADLAVGTIAIGHFEGELGVEVAPVQLDNEEDGDYWMPVFFTEWRGKSLVTADTVALRLSGTPEAAAVDIYSPVGADAVPLRYGRAYEFRVRFSDLSGGGPEPGDRPVNPAPAPIATARFRRHLPPQSVEVDGMPEVLDPKDPTETIDVFRPKLAYPAAAFAGIPSAETLLLNDAAAITAAAAAGTIKGGQPGLRDPDVATLRITVAAIGLAFDVGNTEENPPTRTLYTTERAFPADPSAALTLEFDYVDVTDAETLAAPAAENGPLPIPTGRDVVLTLTPIGKEDAALEYFGSEAARIGRETDFRLRGAPSSEKGLFAPDTDAGRLRAILLRPDEAATASLIAKLVSEGKGVEAENEPASRLASELGFYANGAALSGHTPRRIVFGCSGAIAHLLAPDRSIITFTSKADLVGRWIAVLSVIIDRDWTWRNGQRPAFAIARDGVDIGSLTLPDAINPRVLQMAEAAGQQPDRATSLLVFFDAIDPKPDPPGFPQETSHKYTVSPLFLEASDAEDGPLAASINLPIAVSPTQTPKLVAAGVALSKYRRAEDYSSTEPRERMLWLDFDASPENPRDALFGRVLSYAPDPALTRGHDVAVPPEPPLPIDPEWVRVIRPGQADDRAGLDAMQRLIPTASPTHFLLPIPSDLTRDSRELFGFFVYELRFGHAVGWSTAQGRFGPALRVTGVQHPAPQLACTAMRTSESALASAPYANPVHQGRSLFPPFPATQIWFLLYVQVLQADGKDHRNILLGRRRGIFRERKVVSRVETDLAASAQWTEAEIAAALETYGLPRESPLSVLAVELLPEVQPPADPLGASLGDVRILRASPLVKLSDVCIQPPCAAA